jgi:glycine cleavage system regulatory protein
VTVPDDRSEDLVHALAPLAAQGLLEIRAEHGREEADRGDVTRMSLELVGADRPGIVRDISRVLAARNVSIEELQTATREAPMAGGMLFEATATLLAPPHVSMTELQEVLEELANELMVDLSLSTE